MQQESEVTALFLLFFEYGERVVVGVAGVDADGDAGEAGCADVAAKGILLDVAGGAVVEIIETGFADANDFFV